MNALMSIAVTGAMLIGHWPEAAMVMVLFALAEVIEAKSLDRARNAIRGLLDLTPELATVQQADGTWRETSAKQIAIGSRVRVKPGERIALDGEVLEGRSTINQAPITGESLPVEKSLVIRCSQARLTNRVRSSTASPPLPAIPHWPVSFMR
jgi:Cd2+/Zn2+-exporting ATPase